MASSAFGFIGLGRMGLAMAKRCLGADMAVFGHDVDDAAQKAFAEAGGTPCDSARAVAENCSTVLVIVQTGDQLEEIVLGEHGLAAAKKPQLDCIISATVDPSTLVELSDKVAGTGIQLIDAPVAGAAMAADAGTLIFFVGAPPSVYERQLTLLAPMAETVTRVGDLGAGQVAKSMNNLILHASKAGVTESMALGAACEARYGLDVAAARHAIEQTSGNCWALRKWDFISGYTGPSWTLKDLRTFQAIAAAEELPTPVAETMLTYYTGAGSRANFH